MDLISWTPVIFLTEHRPGQSAPMLEIQALLRCLLCGACNNIKTTPTHVKHFLSADGQQLYSLDEASSYISTAESRFHSVRLQIGRALYCEECGSASNLPPTQAAQLQTDMVRVITREWIDQQVEAAAEPQPRLRQDLEQKVQGAVQRALAELDLPGALQEKIDGLDVEAMVKKELQAHLAEAVKEVISGQ